LGRPSGPVNSDVNHIGSRIDGKQKERIGMRELPAAARRIAIDRAPAKIGQSDTRPNGTGFTERRPQAHAHKVRRRQAIPQNADRVVEVAGDQIERTVPIDVTHGESPAGMELPKIGATLWRYVLESPTRLIAKELGKLLER